MNKICTTKEQSKKLLELGIDVNTADMCWSIDMADLPTLFPYPITDCDNWEHKIPAWSLSALLKLIPNWQMQTQDNGIGILFGYKKCLKIINASTPLDAAFQMVCWLKKNNKI